MSSNIPVATETLPVIAQPADAQYISRSTKELNDLRQKVAGLHFCQEALSRGERDILYLAESLLRWIDERYRQV